MQKKSAIGNVRMITSHEIPIKKYDKHEHSPASSAFIHIQRASLAVWHSGSVGRRTNIVTRR